MGALAGAILDKEHPLAGAIKGGIGAMMAEVIAESLVDRQQIQNEVIQELELEQGRPLSQEDKALFEAAYREKLQPAMNTAKLVVASVMASFGHDPSIAIATAANALENNFAGPGSMLELGGVPKEVSEAFWDMLGAAKNAVADTAEDVYENPDPYVEAAVLGAVPYGDLARQSYMGATVDRYDLAIESLFVASGTNYVKAGGKTALKITRKFGSNFIKRLEDAKSLRKHPANRNTVRTNVEALDLADNAKNLIHKNSLSYTGPTHIYKITNPKGTHKIGESAQGMNKYGQSKRAEMQARKLQRETKMPHKSQILAVVEGKKEARRIETGLIQTLKEEGIDALPGNKGLH